MAINLNIFPENQMTQFEISGCSTDSWRGVVPKLGGFRECKIMAAPKLQIQLPRSCLCLEPAASETASASASSNMS